MIGPLSENPYDPPRSEHSESVLPQSSFLAWERLRLRYNLVIVLCIATATGPGLPGLLSHSRFWQSSFCVVLAANAAYFVGHLVERFFARDPANAKFIRTVLFGALCVVSLAIAVGAVAAEMYPGI